MKVSRYSRLAQSIIISAITLLLAGAFVCAQDQTSPDSTAKQDAPSAAYVGSDMCKGCHSKVAETFGKNPHAATLTEAPSEKLKGCESCHGPGSLHIAGPSANKMINPANLSGPEANDSCSKCHLTDSDAPKSWQHIEAKYWKRGEHNRSSISCTKCHTIHGENKKLLSQPAPGMCTTCHSSVLQQDGKKAAYTHAPVAGGMCLSCHNPHGTSARHNVVANVKSVCGGCHKPDTQDMVKAHGGIPVTDADCASCHDVHSHKKEGALIRANQHMPFKSHQCGTCHKPGSTELVKQERQLCTMCHSKDMASDPTDGQKMHTAVSQGMCTGCHNPHASSAKKAYWKDEKLAYACFKCHPSVEYQTMAKVKHMPLANNECQSCHKPHMSRENNLLVKSEMDLCGQCHKEHALMHPIAKKADGKPVMDPLRKSTLTCTSCHTPHGGQFERMAVRDWKRDLCTGCHSSLH